MPVLSVEASEPSGRWDLLGGAWVVLVPNGSVADLDLRPPPLIGIPPGGWLVIPCISLGLLRSVPGIQGFVAGKGIGVGWILCPPPLVPPPLASL